MQKLLGALERRNITGHFVSSRDEAVNKAIELIPENSSVGFGGSVTLEQIGILDVLRKRKDIDLFDRTQLKDSKQLYELYIKMFSCDVFLSSSNAITEEGQIANVDGRGNRVAMITFGPRKVVIIVGKNKITENLDAAIDRIRKVACPLNVKRLKELAKSSPVASTIEITEEKIWGQVSIIERQLDKDRIHVIIVNEDLGF
jgi:hypothetical protein